VPPEAPDPLWGTIVEMERWTTRGAAWEAACRVDVEVEEGDPRAALGVVCWCPRDLREGDVVQLQWRDGVCVAVRAPEVTDAQLADAVCETVQAEAELRALNAEIGRLEEQAGHEAARAAG
jgi:hypothetical protein